MDDGSKSGEKPMKANQAQFYVVLLRQGKQTKRKILKCDGKLSDLLLTKVVAGR